MDIKPKYEVGDTVKLNIRNSKTIGTITCIEITSVNRGQYDIEYGIENDDHSRTYYEENEILCKID